MKYTYKKRTKVGIIISIVISLLIATMNSCALYRNFNKLSDTIKVYGVFFALLLVIASIGLYLLLIQRKRGLIIAVVAIVINAVYGIIVGESPMLLFVIFLPILYSLLSMSDIFKKLPM